MKAASREGETWSDSRLSELTFLDKDLSKRCACLLLFFPLELLSGHVAGASYNLVTQKEGAP